MDVGGVEGELLLELVDGVGELLVGGFSGGDLVLDGGDLGL